MIVKCFESISIQVRVRKDVERLEEVHGSKRIVRDEDINGVAFD